jgi:hypothetical protein
MTAVIAAGCLNLRAQGMGSRIGRPKYHDRNNCTQAKISRDLRNEMEDVWS